MYTKPLSLVGFIKHVLDIWHFMICLQSLISDSRTQKSNHEEFRFINFLPHYYHFTFLLFYTGDRFNNINFVFFYFRFVRINLRPGRRRIRYSQSRPSGTPVTTPNSWSFSLSETSLEGQRLNSWHFTSSTVITDKVNRRETLPRNFRKSYYKSCVSYESLLIDNKN